MKKKVCLRTKVHQIQPKVRSSIYKSRQSFIVGGQHCDIKPAIDIKVTCSEGYRSIQGKESPGRSELQGIIRARQYGECV